MLKATRLKDIFEEPLPPAALADYDAFSKFMNSSEQRCKASGRSFNVVLEWAIHALTASLTADSASRIFLPKTRTRPFYLDDLLPISDIRPSGRQRIDLRETNLIAPVWNNSDLISAMESFYDSSFEDADISKVLGVFIKELNLTIITASANVDVPYILRVWGRGHIQADTYSLKDLSPVLSTDGKSWYLRREDGSDDTLPVLDTRMAILYNCALRKYC